MKKRRIEYLDAIKAISILLVVFCHFVLLSKETIIGNFLMSMSWIAVPCFMMVSGALMHQSSSFSWKKHFFRLSKIYGVLCIWRLLYFLINCFIKPYSYGKTEVFQYLFLLKDLDGINTGVMWYMIAFLQVLLLFPITWYLFRKNERKDSEVQGRPVLFYMMLAAFAGGILIPSGNWLLKVICDKLTIGNISLNGVSRTMPFSNYANMLFYFIAGAFIFEYRAQICEKTRRFRIWTAMGVLLGTMGLMIIKYVDTGTFTWNNTYLVSGYTHVMTTLAAVSLMLFFMEYEESMTGINHILSKYIGQYTMGIYYLHYAVLTICAAYLYPALQGHYSLGMNLMKSVVVTGICIVGTIVLRKIPWIKNLVQ